MLSEPSGTESDLRESELGWIDGRRGAWVIN